VTHSTATVSLYHHPEDGQITGRNMLVNIYKYIKIHHKIRVHLLVVRTFYKSN
jgi:hypothetical protein